MIATFIAIWKQTGGTLLRKGTFHSRPKPNFSAPANGKAVINTSECEVNSCLLITVVSVIFDEPLL